MPRDQQIKLSKNSICESLLRLLEHYQYNDITISQITAKAGVSRNTFYRHFNTKEAVLSYAFSQLLGDLFTALSNLATPSIRDLLSHIINLYRKNPYLIHVHNHETTGAIISQFRDRNMHRFSDFMVSSDPYRTRFNIAGFDAVLKQWLRDGCQESNDYITDKIVSFISAK